MLPVSPARTTATRRSGPATGNWFQAGAEGALITEFSSFGVDAADVFLDSRVVR